MNTWRMVVAIARWEFLRWFKWKDQILTLVVSCLIGLIIWGGKALYDRESRKVVVIRVINEHLLPFTVPEESRVILQFAPADSEAALRKAVSDRSIGGLLILRNIDQAELVATGSPGWHNELRDQLTRIRVHVKMRLLGLTDDQVADAFRPFTLNIVSGSGVQRHAGVVEKIAAGVVIGLMLLGLLISFAYQFVTITGEKQLRVTEQIISAVSPQHWIDGKILGLSAFATLSTLTYVLSILIFIAISDSFGVDLSIPPGVSSPGTVLALICLGALGYLFWNTFFAALAATINDPNTSAKGSLIFVTLIATIGAALFALTNPDSLISQILTFFPATAPGALACRLVLTDVPGWQILAAFLLLLGGIWLMRIVAGKIFHLGILMYGKEPSFREILRWNREA